MSDEAKMCNAESISAPEEFVTVVLTKQLDISAKEMRWWFERHIKHRFTLRLSWSRGLREDRAMWWDIMGWYYRQEMLLAVIFHLSDEINYPGGNAATFGFENKAEAMLFKLRFGGA